ncbi:MAG: hypothetical protein NT014_07905 [Candidatus Omnitrophica bacterium]|nr:hypothetical protein [Candidatus Omnitrophota bacterium]
MQKNRVLKIFILFVLIAAMSISVFSICIKNKEAYASDNQLITRIDSISQVLSKLDLILQGQKQIQSKINLIKEDLNEIKHKIDTQIK